MAKRLAAKQTETKEDITMALEGSPLPIKIPEDTLAIIRAEAAITGKHINVIAREVLKAWADKKIHSANVLHNHLRSKGFTGIDGFISESQE